MKKFKQKQPKQSYNDKNAMSIIEFNRSNLEQDEYNYEIPASKAATQVNNKNIGKKNKNVIF